MQFERTKHQKWKYFVEAYIIYTTYHSKCIIIHVFFYLFIRALSLQLIPEMLMSGAVERQEQKYFHASE